MWLDRILGRKRAKPLYPEAAARGGHGFAEAQGSSGLGRVPRLMQSGRAGAAWATSGAYRKGGDMAQPFASTGPQGHRGRMREKLLERGPNALADYELLEMLLFFAFKKGDTKPLAKSLINRYGSFANVLTAPQQELLDIPGLGEHSVTAIKLVQDAALRLAKAEVMEKPILNNWDRLIDYLNAALSREKIEQFRILFLDSKNRLIADEAQAKGTVNHTPVYPREVIKRALELHATALILVHNHPSGDPTPSRADIDMTAEIKEAGMVLSVVVHDHIIVGNGRHLSFRREGLL
jgi:DNA repair protein RadC